MADLMTVRLVVRLAFAGAVSSSFAAACTLDWTLRGDPGDAALPEASDGQRDGTPITEAGPPDVDAPDAEIDSGCAALLARVDETRKAARACTQAVVPAHCATKVMAQCCEVFVAQPGTKATMDFQAAVAALVDSGCPLGCTGCTALPVVGTCIQLPSLEFTCSP